MTMRKQLIFTCLLVLVPLMVGSEAQSAGGRGNYRCPERPESDAEIVALAGDLFDDGERLIEKRKFEKGLKKFLCSAEMRDHVNITFNIAQAARYIKNKKKTKKYFQRFVERNPETFTAKELEKLILYLDGET